MVAVGMAVVAGAEVPALSGARLSLVAPASSAGLFSRSALRVPPRFCRAVFWRRSPGCRLRLFDLLDLGPNGMGLAPGMGVRSVVGSFMGSFMGLGWRLGWAGLVIGGGPLAAPIGTRTSASRVAMSAFR